MSAITWVHRRIRAASDRPSALLAAFPLALLFALACNGSKEVAKEEAPPTGPRRGGTAVVAVISGPQGVNEYVSGARTNTREVLSMLFLNLASEQPDFTDHPPTFKPELAERWEYSSDKRSLTFFLRQDITWSDGVAVTADDVRFSWQAQSHPDIGWVGAEYKEPIEDVEVIDAHTVRFHFEYPFAGQMLYANEGVIIPKHAWSALPFDQWRANADWFLEHLVVSGPFTIDSWRANDEFRLVRNERYFDPELPYLDQVVLRVIPDRASQLVQLEAGSVDYINAISPDDRRRIMHTPNLVFTNYWGRGYAFISWNLRKPLFDDSRVRRALTMAIDRQAIVETLWGEFGRLAITPVPQNIWASKRDLPPIAFDPKEAMKILAEQGWSDHDGDGTIDRDGKPFAFELVTNLGNQQRMDSIVMVQEHLARIGIEVTTRNIPFNSLMPQLNTGDYDAVLIKLSVATDLDFSQYHSRNIASGRNFYAYSDPEVDGWLEAARRVEKAEDMGPYLDKIQDRLYRDEVHTFVWESQIVGAHLARLHGPEPNLLRTFWGIEKWWMEPRG